MLGIGRGAGSQRGGEEDKVMGGEGTPGRRDRGNRIRGEGAFRIRKWALGREELGLGVNRKWGGGDGGLREVTGQSDGNMWR